MKWTVLVIFGVLGPVSGQVIAKGPCPSVKVQDNFDLSRYIGKWYEQKRFYAIFEMFSKQTTADYTLYDDGINVKVNNTGYDRLLKSHRTEIGRANIVDPQEPSKLMVQFEGSPGGKYWVLSTDYDTYTVVWSCSEEKLGPIVLNTQFSWILTRQQQGLKPTKLAELMDMMAAQGIVTSHFMDTVQTQ